MIGVQHAQPFIFFLRQFIQFKIINDFKLIHAAADFQWNFEQFYLMNLMNEYFGET